LPWSLVLASTGAGLAGWAPSYGVLLLLVVVSALGIAAYHPEGYIALAQAYLPRRLGLAAGLSVGLAIGLGGIGVAVLGWVADHWGLRAALAVIAAMPLAGFALALFLPEPRQS
jgi:FSR family fosmidomycin resistance protein-like MFS transporter